MPGKRPVRPPPAVRAALRRRGDQPDPLQRHPGNGVAELVPPPICNPFKIELTLLRRPCLMATDGENA
jgi:hypothetical protein